MHNHRRYSMIETRDSKQNSFFGNYVYDKIVSKDHILRKIQSTIDLSFVTELCHDAYCLVIQDHPTPSLQEYIKWGERQGYHQRSVTKNQSPWYKPTRQMLGGAKILIPRSFNDSFVMHYNPKCYL